ncbi:hypothetical protein ABT160_37000 [Streptomyces sp. NPDC001941]|uniref:hypothetical protein n=1 Tax=Streptomyces sp. NPDC001941 TaxID=3154659 RepID=UPI00331E23AA
MAQDAAPATARTSTTPTAQAAAAVTKISHSNATGRFTAAGITWTSSGGCSDRNRSNCTSFDQLNLASAQGAVTLKKASGCALLITGGTETGHASGTYSHWNGYKLDFNPTTCLTNYITRNFTHIADRGDGAKQYKAASGNIYARESSHWDVTFYNCGGC